MTFAAAAFLFALPLALAPLLLHLFDRRRSVVIKWGAMQFLQEAVTRRTSARRFQQWLLLALRIVAVLLLVLALSGPVLPFRWFAASPRQQWVFVIDNSLSTATRNAAGETRLAAILREVVERVDKLPPGDSVRLVAASPRPTWLTPNTPRLTPVQRDRIRAELAQIQPTQASSRILESLLAAIQSEPPEQAQTRHVVLLTDGHAHDWQAAETEAWQRLPATLEAVPLPTRVQIRSVAAPEEASVGNVHVTSVDCSRTTVGPGQTVTFRGQVRNASRQLQAPLAAAWRIGQQQLAAATVPEIQPGQTHSVVLQHTFREPGVYAVQLRLEIDEPLIEDNQNFVIVEVRDQVPILVVEGSLRLADVQQDTYFVTAALGHAEAEAETWRSLFSPTVASPEQLENLPLSDYHAVVIPHLTSLSKPALDALEKFVAEGGGLWLAVGPRTELEFFNERLYRQGQGLAPLPLETLVESERQTSPYLAPAQSPHRVNRLVADAQRLDLADVRVTSYFRFADSERVAPLLALSNAAPVGVERDFFAGRVIVFAIPLRYQWSDLVMAEAFVVLVEEYLAYLTEPRATRYNLEPGEPIAVALNRAPRGDAPTDAAAPPLKPQYGIQGPDRSRWELAAEPTLAGRELRTTRTHAPGLYELTGVGEQRLRFHVARDPAESQLTSLTPAQTAQLGEVAGIVAGETMSPSYGGLRRQPVWSLLLAGLLVCLVTELALSGVTSRARFGRASAGSSGNALRSALDWLQVADRSLQRGSSHASGAPPARPQRAAAPPATPSAATPTAATPSAAPPTTPVALTGRLPEP